MALSNVDIFNMTPKTDCKECGSSNCKHFSYRVYQGATNILACPYISRESLAAVINETIASIDTYKRRNGDTRHISGGNMVCPDCKNKIKEDMKFCPFCGKKIPEKKMEVEDVFISDTNKTTEVFQAEDLEIYDPNETSGVYLGEGLELIDLYTQNKNDQTYQEEKVEEAIFSDTDLKEKSPKILDSYSGNEDMVCPDCKNKIEKNMKFCPFCGKKIPEKEVRTEEVFVPDINEIGGTSVKEKTLKGFVSCVSDDNNVIFQEESVKDAAFSNPKGISEDLQEEILGSESVSAPNKSEDTDNKDILEVFTASNRDKIRAAFEKSLVAINKIEDALLRQEKFNQEKAALAKKKQELAEEISNAQILIVLSVIPVAIILFVVFYISGEGILSGIVGTLFWGTGYCFIVYVIYKIIEYYTRPSKKIEADKWYNEQIDPLMKKEDEFLKKFKDYCRSDEVIFAQKIVPEEYFDSESVQYFIQMLKNGRADTYKEVINLYEEHLHRERMETMQMQSLTLQGENLEETRQLSQTVKAQNEQLQKQTEYMKKISKNTKSTARAVKVNAFIGAVSGHSQSKKLKRIERNTR